MVLDFDFDRRQIVQLIMNLSTVDFEHKVQKSFCALGEMDLGAGNPKYSYAKLK
jgi:hypothetical protein